MPKKKPLCLPGLARAPRHLRLVGAPHPPPAVAGGPDSDPPPAPAAAAPVHLPPAPAPTRALLEQLEREAA